VDDANALQYGGARLGFGRRGGQVKRMPPGIGSRFQNRARSKQPVLELVNANSDSKASMSTFKRSIRKGLAGPAH
jgi:hypothetical protein